jgi:hypothetical protein
MDEFVHYNSAPIVFGVFGIVLEQSSIYKSI